MDVDALDVWSPVQPAAPICDAASDVDALDGRQAL